MDSKDVNVTSPGKRAAKSFPIRANTTQMSFDRRDQRQIAFALTPGDRANARDIDQEQPPQPQPDPEPEGRA